MKKFAIVLALMALGIVWAMLPAGATGGGYGTTTTHATTTSVDRCEYNPNHPFCTTTTNEGSTTTQPETTTTTKQETTTSFTEQTTTTVDECPPGFDHQPPLCVEVTTTLLVDDTTTTVIGPVPMDPPEELPFTGLSVELLAGAGLVALISGAALRRLARG